MKIFVTGTRGIPNISGGVESHCQQLYPLIASDGCDVLLSRRKPYVQDSLKEWNGVHLTDEFAPRKKSFEAIVHTAISVYRAKKWSADIVHIHAIGPALLAPFARALGMKVVVTNHGPDYDRQKWGQAAKLVLQLGEYLGGKFANEVIVISKPIQEIIKRRCGRESHLIFNGVDIPEIRTESGYLQSLNLEPQNYILTAARLVPEKALDDLIDAFEKADTTCKLVIAGDADHKDEYSERLKEKAKRFDNVLMPGYVMGEDLAQLFSHAKLFALPSYHEGLPIALLEALSYGLPVVVSDIPANKEVNLDEDDYFKVGNVEELVKKIEQKVKENQSLEAIKKIRDHVGKTYNWGKIAESTMAVYRMALANG